MTFLSGHVALFLGIVALIATVTARQLTKDELFRRDVSGAAMWFGLFVLLRVNAFWEEDVLTKEYHAYVRVLWMLAFAYGSVRAAVSVVLLAQRRFSAKPTAKIHRDVADFFFYLAVTIPILKTQLKLDVTTLLGTSAVLSLVLGFALQDTLGNLFSGLSLQLERPFQVGDFIKVGDSTGCVVQIAWRSTRIETMRREVVTLPNSVVAKEKVTNFTRGGLPVGLDLTISASYAAAPNTVKAEVLETLREAPLVLNDPAPWVRVHAFGDSAIQYLVRVFIADYASVPHVHDEILGRLWYRFARAGIEIPFPQRVVHLRQEKAAPVTPARNLLSKIDLFSPFNANELGEIAAAAVERRFGAGEEVVTEGREGETFFCVVSGELSVRVGQPPREVAKLSTGQSFGEMSLLTGEPRSASVVALEDCVLYELGRDVFSRHFTANPVRAQQLAELLEKRKAELAAVAAAPAGDDARKEARILERLRDIFRIGK